MQMAALKTLKRLREGELDEARRAVAEALAEEEAARRAFTAAEDEICRETRVAAGAPDDASVERFACWLKHGRQRLRAAETALAEAAAVTAGKRAEWQLARAALEAVSTTLERGMEQLRRQHLAADQRRMDDHAGRSAALRPLDD